MVVLKFNIQQIRSKAPFIQMTITMKNVVCVLQYVSI